MDKYFTKSKPLASGKARFREPRKRFRRKVSGLFGEQTDLHRRMTRLLKSTNREELLTDGAQGPKKTSTELENEKRSSSNVDEGRSAYEQATEALIAEMSSQNSQRSDFHSASEWDPEVREVLKAPDTIALIQSKIGNLTPLAHQVFLETLKVGTSSSASRKTSPVNHPIEPPELPQFAKGCCLVLPKSDIKVTGERTSAPAVLRRNVRKRYQGYTSADVLRQRQGREIKEGEEPEDNDETDDDRTSPSSFRSDRPPFRNDRTWRASRAASTSQNTPRRIFSDLRYQPHSEKAATMRDRRHHVAEDSIALLAEAAEVASEQQRTSGQLLPKKRDRLGQYM